MIEVNYWAILVCGVAAMVLGFVWYGPLFGKKWIEIIGASTNDLAARAEMQKRMMPLYAVQFGLVLFQAWVLSYYLAALPDVSGVVNALWIWAAFVMPTVAGSSMWNNDSAKVSWARFLIQGGYQLVLFVLFALILSSWH